MKVRFLIVTILTSNALLYPVVALCSAFHPGYLIELEIEKCLAISDPGLAADSVLGRFLSGPESYEIDLTGGVIVIAREHRRREREHASLESISFAAWSDANAGHQHRFIAIDVSICGKGGRQILLAERPCCDTIPASTFRCAANVDELHLLPPGMRDIASGKETFFECPEDAVLTGRGCLTEPKLLKRIEPNYPEGFTDLQTTATVILSAVVQADGRIGNLDILRASPEGIGLEEAAEEAVLRWLYSPARIEGQPVPVHLTIVVHFPVIGARHQERR